MGGRSPAAGSVHAPAQQRLGRPEPPVRKEKTDEKTERDYAVTVSIAYADCRDIE
jgi:hypothetical protein